MNIFIFRDAWSSLGDMTKEEAMIAYVEEMKKVGEIAVENIQSKCNLILLSGKLVALRNKEIIIR